MKSKKIEIHFLLLAGVLALTAGCAKRDKSLAEARDAYQQAANDPEVAKNAPVALHEAELTLNKAVATDDKRERRHLADLTKKQVEIAKFEAQRKDNESNLNKLNEERSETLLDARSREAQAAKMEAARAKALAESATRKVQERDRQLAELQSKQTERGTVFTLRDVMFAVNKADLQPGAQRLLEKNIELFNQEPNRKVMIEGHTDSTGSDEFNQQLSQRRAEAVRSFLVQNGIDPSRVTAKGLGKSYPVAENDSAAGRQQNRRVEILLLNEGQGKNSGNSVNKSKDSGLKKATTTDDTPGETPVPSYSGQ